MNPKKEKENISFGIDLMQSISIIVLAILVIFLLITLTNQQKEIDSMPHKYCKEQFIQCWYKDNLQIESSCYLEFSNIEGYDIIGEIQHKLECDGNECYEKYLREVCEIR
jgi:hypothetical protein